ncbi:MAG: methyltransferase [Chitinophagales bacterium]|nr:methyltransferase [Chitinophagales bacterium]
MILTLFIKKIAAAFYQPVIAGKIHRTSFYKWNGIQLRIPPGVFHPKYFFSTKLLLRYVLQLDLQDKKFLELGAGNGLISIAAAKRGAIVTSSDVSKRAIKSLHENAQKNDVQIRIVESDLFDTLEGKFDIIAINPPYYPKTPRNEFEAAWYCGEHFEYFEKLFMQLNEFTEPGALVLMVLSEDCKLDVFQTIAQKYNFIFREALRKRIMWEWNYIFQIQKIETK